MKNVRIAFEEFEGDVSAIPPGYQEIRCHMIFDIKMGENFRRKARMVADGHRTETPAALTYSSVVSRDSVRIALTIAALNDLSVLACDIQNAYLTAKCREKVWTRAGPEFGSDAGKIMLVVRALYRLKSSGAAFRALLAETLYDLNYRPTKADPDVWLRSAVKPDGFEYYEPDTYLGAGLSKKTTVNGTFCWSMLLEAYCKVAVKNVEQKLSEDGKQLPTKCDTPMKLAYQPELKAEGVQYYQELVDVLRWTVELGQVDILYEVATMLTHLAMPRIGHFEELLHIFGYLTQGPTRKLVFDPDHPMINDR